MTGEGSARGVESLRYRTVIWDFDGTLVDTSEGIFRSLRRAFTALGLGVPAQKVLQKFVGPPLLHSLQTYTGLDEETAVRALWTFRADYEREGIYRSRPYDGLFALVGRLRAAGARVGVATLKPERMARLLLEHFGAAPLFDAVVGSGEDERGEITKAQMVRAVMERVGCEDASQAVLIGDTAFDAEGARRAGVDFVGVSYGFGITPERAGKLGCRYLARDAADVVR